MLGLLIACDGDSAAHGDGRPGDPPTDTAPPTGCGAPPSLEVAAGTLPTEFVTEGEVTVVHGPQGGWHVDTAGVVEGTAREVTVTPTLTVPALGGLWLNPTQDPSTFALADYEADQCAGTFYAMRAYLLPELPAEVQCMQELVCTQLPGEVVRIEVSVVDSATGDTLVDTVELTLANDAVDREICQTPADHDADGDGVRDLCDLGPVYPP